MMIQILLDVVHKVCNKFILRFNDVSIETYQIRGVIFLKNEGQIKIGENFKVNSGLKYNPIGGDSKTILKVNRNASLCIGNNVGISNSTIYCTDKIVIGNNVFIGGGSKIWDTDFHSLKSTDRKSGDKNIKTKPVLIHDDVFIGGGSIILKGCEIGNNVVIGAGSVVTKSIPANEIWGGNPARYIKKNE